MGNPLFCCIFVIFESVEMPGNRSPTWSTKNILVSLDKLIYEVSDHFVQVHGMVNIGSGAKRAFYLVHS